MHPQGLGVLVVPGIRASWREGGRDLRRPRPSRRNGSCRLNTLKEFSRFGGWPGLLTSLAQGTRKHRQPVSLDYSIFRHKCVLPRRRIRWPRTWSWRAAKPSRSRWDSMLKSADEALNLLSTDLGSHNGDRLGTTECRLRGE